MLLLLLPWASGSLLMRAVEPVRASSDDNYTRHSNRMLTHILGVRIPLLEFTAGDAVKVTDTGLKVLYQPIQALQLAFTGSTSSTSRLKV
jgi:hypothetical protein